MMTYSYDAESNTVCVVAEGRVSPDDPIAYFKRVSMDPEIQRGALEIVDLSKVTAADFGYADVSRIRQEFERFCHYRRFAKTVFRANSDLTYGLARMISTLLEPAGHPFDVERVSP